MLRDVDDLLAERFAATGEYLDDSDWDNVLRRAGLSSSRGRMFSTTRAFASSRFGLTVTAVVALGLATACLVVVRSAGRSHTAAVAPPRASEVKQRVLLAVNASDGLILKETTVEVRPGLAGGAGTTRSEQWADLTADRRRDITCGADGKPIVEVGMSVTGNSMQVDFVIYGLRAWQTTTQSVSGPSGRDTGPEALAAEIRRELSSGIVRLIGTDNIDGHSLLHLTRPLGVSSTASAAPHSKTYPTLEMWVDPSTYLPVRQQIRAGPNAISQTTYDWLPRTAVNLAELKLVVPPGFTHETGSRRTNSNGKSSSGYTIILTPAHR